MRSPRRLAAAAAFVGLLFAAQADAGIIGGGATMMDPPTSPLGPNPIGDTSFFAFYERQNVTLDRDLKLGRMKQRNAEGRKVRKPAKIARGTLVSSHYVLYDPAELTKQSVTITFDSEILGVVTKGKGLKRTDFLGADGVEYKKFRYRSPERRDQYEISADGRSITFYFRANNPGDYIRVITAGGMVPPPPPPPPIDPQPVPEPGAALLFGIGAGLVRFFTGRKLRPSR
jgi:hypothetical protein